MCTLICILVHEDISHSFGVTLALYMEHKCYMNFIFTGNSQGRHSQITARNVQAAGSGATDEVHRWDQEGRQGWVWLKKAAGENANHGAGKTGRNKHYSTLYTSFQKSWNSKHDIVTLWNWVILLYLRKK